MLELYIKNEDPWFCRRVHHQIILQAILRFEDFVPAARLKLTKYFHVCLNKNLPNTRFIENVFKTL
jgi:hypothetical protein